MSEEKLYKQTMKELEECEATLNSLETKIKENANKQIESTSKIIDEYCNNLDKIYTESDATFEKKTKKYR